MSNLPDKPSELICSALADLAACETDPRYIVRMSTWHTPVSDAFGFIGLVDVDATHQQKYCAVCLAGAVMAKSLGVSFNAGACPAIFGDVGNSDIEHKLMALNEFRMGFLSTGLGLMNFSRSVQMRFRDCPVVDYHASPGRFRSDMMDIALRFELAGL